MPIYEYECEFCGKEKEVQHKITEQPDIECDCMLFYQFDGPCRGPVMKRKISKSSFSLKGSGWAKDLYSGGKK